MQVLKRKQRREGKCDTYLCMLHVLLKSESFGIYIGHTTPHAHSMFLFFYFLSFINKIKSGNSMFSHYNKWTFIYLSLNYKKWKTLPWFISNQEREKNHRIRNKEKKEKGRRINLHFTIPIPIPIPNFQFLFQFQSGNNLKKPNFSQTRSYTDKSTLCCTLTLPPARDPTHFTNIRTCHPSTRANSPPPPPSPTTVLRFPTPPHAWYFHSYKIDTSLITQCSLGPGPGPGPEPDHRLRRPAFLRSDPPPPPILSLFLEASRNNK